MGPYNFSPQASVDHDGYSVNSGHYTASINYYGKTFHCNDNEITECNITDTYNSSTAYIFCTNSSWNVRAAICPEGLLSSLALSSVYSPTVEDGSWSTPMVHRHRCLSLYNRYKSRHRKLWDGQCVSSWRPLVWLGHLWWFIRVYIYIIVYLDPWYRT